MNTEVNPYDVDKYFVSIPLVIDLGVVRARRYVNVLGPFPNRDVAEARLTDFSRSARNYNLNPADLEIIRRRSIKRGVLMDQVEGVSDE